MNEIDQALRRLLAALTELLQTTPQAASFLELLAPLAGGVARPTAGSDLPVTAHLAQALAQAGGFAKPITQLRPALAFVQNPNYRAAPPSPRFLDNYGYAVIAGPGDGPPALLTSPALAFGLLLLGPQTEYPPHHHPAAEIYVPLGEAEWRLAGGGWRTRPSGSVIYHAPGVEHATRTGEAPLAALYLWRGDLATHARLLPGR
jgi:Dimethlysulfonioproprionate lyase